MTESEVAEARSSEEVELPDDGSERATESRAAI